MCHVRKLTSLTVLELYDIIVLYSYTSLLCLRYFHLTFADKKTRKLYNINCIKYTSFLLWKELSIFPNFLALFFYSSFMSLLVWTTDRNFFLFLEYFYCQNVSSQDTFIDGLNKSVEYFLYTPSNKFFDGLWYV